LREPLSAASPALGSSIHFNPGLTPLGYQNAALRARTFVNRYDSTHTISPMKLTFALATHSNAAELTALHNLVA